MKTFTNSHHNDYIHELMKGMFYQKYDADVTIVTEDNQKIEAHKVILKACSPIFKNMFEKASVIFLSEINCEELNHLLQFMYFGLVSVDEDKMETFIELGKKFQIIAMFDSEIVEEDIQEKLQNDCVIENETVDDKNGVNGDFESIRDREENFELFPKMNDENVVKDKTLEWSQETKSEYKCSQCDYSTTTKKFLVSHRNSKHHSYEQTEARKFSCSHCEKRFLKQVALDKHIKIHDRIPSDSKITCSECNKEFSSETNLKKHSKAHTIESNLQCEMCDYSTHLNYRLNLHKMNIHDIGKLSCTYCEYTTSVPLHLKRHTNYHHQENK